MDGTAPNKNAGYGPVNGRGYVHCGFQLE